MVLDRTGGFNIRSILTRPSPGEYPAGGQRVSKPVLPAEHSSVVLMIRLGHVGERIGSGVIHPPEFGKQRCRAPKHEGGHAGA